jgi:hypothetical protein
MLNGQHLQEITAVPVADIRVYMHAGDCGILFLISNYLIGKSSALCLSEPAVNTRTTIKENNTYLASIFKHM